MILIINVGSASIKYKLFEGDKMVRADTLDRIGCGNALNHVQAWEKLLQGLSSDINDIKLVAYKYDFEINGLSNILKLNETNLKTILDKNHEIPFQRDDSVEITRLAMAVLPKASHFAVFDNMLFSGLENKVQFYPIDYQLSQQSIKKIGTQGISHAYSLKKAQDELGMIRTQKTVSVHLGNTCSAVAFREGVAVDCSGGFTPIGGLMGINTPGDIDAGIIIKLLKDGKSLEEIEEMLSENSGVHGVSQLSSDMRDVLYIAGYKVDDDKYIPSNDLPRQEEYIGKCRLAIEMFVDRIAKCIGSYITVLEGLDALVITGTIGYKSSEIRTLILNKLSFIKDYEVYIVEPNEELEIKMMVESTHKEVESVA